MSGAGVIFALADSGMVRFSRHIPCHVAFSAWFCCLMHIACICRREARGSVCECVFVNLLCVSWSSHVMYLCVLSVVHSLSHWRAANDTRHTHSCSCTQTYKNTQIYVDANAHTPFGHAHERVHFNSRFQRRRVNAGLIFFLLIIFFPPTRRDVIMSPGLLIL